MNSILQLDEDARIQANHYTALVLMNEISEQDIVSLVDTKEVGGLVIIVPINVAISLSISELVVRSRGS